MTDVQTSSDADAFLAHFGVKGMRWGVVNEDSGAGASSGLAKQTSGSVKPRGPVQLNAREKKVLKSAGLSESDSAIMDAKYGPMKPEPEPKGLSPRQKKVLIGVVAGVGVAGAAYYVHKTQFGKPSIPFEFDYQPKNPAPPPREESLAFKSAWNNYLTTASKREAGYTPEMVASLKKDPVEYPAGHVFKRVSTSRETYINPDGFYASGSDQDTERYKAILPVFWKLQRRGNEGHVVSLKANSAIKAPSEAETFSLFRSSLKDRVPSDMPKVKGKNPTMRDLLGGEH